jgi:hypothetical protein
MSKTRAQIQFKAFAILVGGDVGTTPSAEDTATLDGYIDSEVAELSSDGTIYIDDPDELPDELFTVFCKLVANAAADEYGGKSDERSANAAQPPAGDRAANAGVRAAASRVFLMAAATVNPVASIEFSRGQRARVCRPPDQLLCGALGQGR